MFRQTLESAQEVVAAAAMKAVRESAAKASREYIDDPVGIGLTYLPTVDPRRLHRSQPQLGVSESRLATMG